MLSDHGLEHALRALAQRAAVPVELDVALPEERLPMAIEAAAYFAVSEALTNVARYAKASQVCVSVEERDGHLIVTVRDDGVGGADPSAGSGLQGLRDRLAALDGSLEIDSLPGTGTQLRARLPSRAVPATGTWRVRIIETSFAPRRVARGHDARHGLRRRPRQSHP